ncbi:hypothetical protein FO519_008224 [Halicephalobus sp. NKZ332]|nr:hypothetical protein FO519_008224 [Halicephalobus sp. NKZ332]
MSDQEGSPAHAPQDKGFGDHFEELKQKTGDFVGNLQEKGHEAFENVHQQGHDFLENFEKERNFIPDFASEEHKEFENVHKQAAHDDLPESPAEEHHEPPKDPLADILDNVNEVLPEPVRHSPLTDTRREIEEGIESAVNDTRDEVDAILGRLNTGSPHVQEQNSPSGDSERDTLAGLLGDRQPEPQIPVSDSLSGMREISPDEQIFDRRGPLKIPENISYQNSDSPIEEIPPAPGSNFEEDFEQVPPHHSHFDDLPARPPTPPKDLSDEDDVRPPAINLGPPSHVHEKSADHGLKPILRHHSGLGPWIDFKSVDPRALDEKIKPA